MSRLRRSQFIGLGSRRLLLRIGGVVVVGIAATLIMAWPVPLALLRWGEIEHRRVLQPGLWMGPGEMPYAVAHSKLWLSERYILQPMLFWGRYPMAQNRAEIPDWVARSPERDEALLQVDTQARGWPLPALASESWTFGRSPLAPSAPDREELRHSLVLSKAPGGRIMLPLRPIWPGLIGNTIIFAAAWLGAIGAIGATRRTIRRRRGRCAACGYDLRATAPGLECPECGATR